METMSNHTVIIHRRKYTRVRYCLFCGKTNTFHQSPPLLEYLPLGSSRWRHLTRFSWCPSLPEPGAGGCRGKKNKDASLISGKMLLLPSGPAVLFPCRALKLLKLTYYLLDWANMFVFCVHVCASARSPPFFPSF